VIGNIACSEGTFEIYVISFLFIAKSTMKSVKSVKSKTQLIAFLIPVGINHRL